MRLEYEKFKQDIDRYTELGMNTPIHIFKDGQHVMDITPRSTTDNPKIKALYSFAGAIPQPEKSPEEYRDERLSRQ